MCASYGLDSRLPDYKDFRRGLMDLSSSDLFESWVEQNAGATIRPTGVNARNLNPLLRADGIELAWWGYAPTGVPAKYPTINARSETLLTSATWKRGFRERRGLAPMTHWFEYQQPGKTKYSLGTGKLLMAGVVTAPATIEEGPVSCYSLIMQPAAEHLAYIHDRSPLLISEELMEDWLDPETVGDQTLLDAAIAASEELLSEVTAALA